MGIIVTLGRIDKETRFLEGLGYDVFSRGPSKGLKYIDCKYEESLLEAKEFSCEEAIAFIDEALMKNFGYLKHPEIDTIVLSKKEYERLRSIQVKVNELEDKIKSDSPIKVRVSGPMFKRDDGTWVYGNCTTEEKNVWCDLVFDPSVISIQEIKSKGGFGVISNGRPFVGGKYMSLSNKYIELTGDVLSKSVVYRGSLVIRVKTITLC